MKLKHSMALWLIAVTPAMARVSVPNIGDLEMTGAEYRPLVEQLRAQKDGKTQADPLDDILVVGKRNLDWIAAINQSRSASAALQLSTPETQVGYPIDQPVYANPTLILALRDQVYAALPDFMNAVLLKNGTFVTSLPVSDDEFLTHARDIDRVYQKASRWQLEAPYLDEYAAGAVDDVRGYYFLTQNPNIDAQLKQWSTLSAETKTQYHGWLVQMCENVEQAEANCDSDLNTAESKNSVDAYFQKYLAGAQKHYNDYFVLLQARSDVTWSQKASADMDVPFIDPGRPDVVQWLKDNIEDEWKTAEWNLRLKFQPTGPDSMTHIAFQAGATPHVNGIAGNIITMDGNRSLQEYTSRWTIRHEYGHVLGFPDCYLEFYDKPSATMVSYQLDITNLMCSRRGHFQALHYNELRKNYFK